MKIPPYERNPDGKSCALACLRMGIRYFEPEREISYNELERLTRRRKGEGTWPHGTYAALQEMGYEMKAYEPVTDYAAFIADPEGFFRGMYSADVAEQVIRKYDLAAAARDAADIHAKGFKLEKGVPTLDGMRKLLEAGYLLMPHTDFNRLHGRDKKPDGHAILVYAMDETSLTLHDPDWPGTENDWAGQTIAMERFVHAWDYLGADKREMLAFRKRA